MIDALVTGAEGFIGQALVRRLQDTEDAKVFALARRNGDVGASSTWDDLPPARVVYHLAGRSYVPDSWTDGAGFLVANVIGTEHALTYCRRHGAALVLASAYVYGIPARVPIREDDPVRPSNPYALSKLLAEELCAFASRVYGLTTTALRSFNVYGPGQRPEFLIPSIIRQVRQRKPVRVLTLTPKRDYVFLDDVVEALLRAARSPAGFRTLNIGSGVSYSVAEVIDIIQSAAGTALPIDLAEIERAQEIPDALADISRAKELLGWVPKWSFEDGIRSLLRE